MFSAKSSFRPVPLYVNAISTTDEPFVLDQSELNLTEYPSPEYDFHDDVLDVELFFFDELSFEELSFEELFFEELFFEELLFFVVSSSSSKS